MDLIVILNLILMKNLKMEVNSYLKTNILRKLVSVMFLFLSIMVYAQDKVVTGTVVDKDKEPLIGLSVTIEGTTRGVITDIDGKYSISVNPTDVLLFSYVGMSTQKVIVGNKSVINVSMDEDFSIVLDETVVIGYGSAKKQDLTGSIGRVNSSDILRQPSVNAVSSVQGKVSGVNVVSSDVPGSSPTVVIRGLGTALGGRNPLYIVDGFPVDNISTISPSDIVSMDVLKDASSASIYGVRAANGVIMITTKQGKQGSPKVTVDSYVGFKKAYNSVKMANAQQYIQYYNETMDAIGQTDKLLSTNQPFNTNWYDELLKTGISNNNTVSISGGGEHIDYFLSYNYYNEKGLLEDQKYQRSTIRNNNTYKLFNDRLTITQNLNISFGRENPKPLGAFDDAYRQSPLVPTKYENGRYGLGYYNQTTGVIWNDNTEPNNVYGKLNSIGNPLFSVANADEVAKTFSLQGGAEASFKITDYLKANTRFGATKSYYKNRQFDNIKDKWLNSTDPTRKEETFIAGKEKDPSSIAYANNSLRLENVENFRWTWEGFLSFDKKIKEHHIEAVLGMSRERQDIGSVSILKGYDVPEKSQYWDLSKASSNYAKEINQFNFTPRALASYFARVQYNFNNKYYFSGTIRRDGTSAFKTSNKKWGTFPAVGLGWTISNEEFMQGVKFLNFLKLRATWGKLGNQDVPLDVTQIYSKSTNSNYNYSFGSPAGYYQGAAYGTPAVGVSWEITRESSIGFDFTAFNQRLSGGFDYYDKTNTNTILKVNPILTSPTNDPYYTHGAKVGNRGIEFNLSWRDELPIGLTYEVGFNYSYNKNKVKSVSVSAEGQSFDGDTGGSLSNGQITKRLKKGQPLYSWWMYEAVGVWQSQEEIDAASSSYQGLSAKPGYLKYKDQNNDGIIDDRDKIYAGSYMPSSTYGINVSLGYKNFDFSIDGYGVSGNKIFNGLKNARIDGGENITRKVYNQRWTGEGSTNKHPGANRDTYPSTYYLESGAYFRINNITLGYTFKDVLVKGANIRLYATAQNPFIFTKYSGFNPEISGVDMKTASVKEGDGLPNRTAGIELSAYPMNRTLLFGVNLQF